MWNATKIKREQRRLDEMVTSVGMPPGWEPVGWVCFEVKADPRRTPGSRESWATRKKVLPESFDTPVAAAAALILAGLVEVERAYIRGNR